MSLSGERTRLHVFLDRLRGRRRPPTGPLTNDEARDAEALRQKAHPDDQPESGPARSRSQQE
jgi:hypothetical protein